MIFDTSYALHPTVGVPSRAGTVWSLEEDMTLDRAFAEGCSLETMCKAHQRSATGVLKRLELQGLIRASGTGWVVTNTPLDQINQPPKEETMNKTEPTIEAKVFINGRDASTMTDAQIFNLIGDLETEMDVLLKIRARPKKLEMVLEGIRADIDKLVTYVDGR